MNEENIKYFQFSNYKIGYDACSMQSQTKMNAIKQEINVIDDDDGVSWVISRIPEVGCVPFTHYAGQ